MFSLSLSLSLSLLIPPSLVSPNQQMVNDSCTGCTRAIVSVALLYWCAENRVTTCVVCGLSNMGLLKNDTASVLTVVDDLYQYSVFNMFDFFYWIKLLELCGILYQCCLYIILTGISFWTDCQWFIINVIYIYGCVSSWKKCMTSLTCVLSWGNWLSLFTQVLYLIIFCYFILFQYKPQFNCI